MENQKVVWAKINTKSNYRSLNGEVLKVARIRSNFVSCWHTHENGMVDMIDFTLDEIERFEGLDFWQDYL